MTLGGAQPELEKKPSVRVILVTIRGGSGLGRCAKELWSHWQDGSVDCGRCKTNSIDDGEGDGSGKMELRRRVGAL